MKISKHNISNILCSALCIAAAIFSVSLMSSCTDDIDTPDVGAKEGYITIALSNSKLATRADEDPTNEFLIKKALVCFFAGEAPVAEAKPVYANVFDVNLVNNAEIKIRLTSELLNTFFPAGGTKVTAYVIANLDGNVPEGGENPDGTQALDMTLAELKSIAIESDFAKMSPQSSFVMDGQGIVTLDRTPDKDPAKSSASGTVDLQRAAAKIMLGIRLKDSVEDDAGETWKPMPGSMKVIISNGVKKSNVTPDPDAVTADDYYNTEWATSTDSNYGARDFKYNDKADQTEGYPYELTSPFYTYPTQWDKNPTSLGEDITYLQLMVPWEMQKESETPGELVGAQIYRTCYYAIPLLQKDNVIERNFAYQININVDILGTFLPDQPEPIPDASYRAVEWGIAPVDVNIQDYRYLVLDQTEYTVNNAASIDIPFYSSHETVVIYQDLSYSLYNTQASGIVKNVSISEAVNAASDYNGGHIYSIVVDNRLNGQTGTRTLTFNHELVQWTPLDADDQTLTLGPNSSNGYPSESVINTRINNIVKYVHTDDPAYSTYVAHITIVHKDKVTYNGDDIVGYDKNFAKEITITQYPAMYIETTQNFYGGTSRDERTPERGNMFVNGNQQYITSNQWNSQWSGRWYVAYGLGGDAANANPNQYVITITNLSAGDDYVIDDPRVTVINNLTTNFTGNAPADGWAKAPAITDGTNGNVDNVANNRYRQLTYYYPTDSKRERMNVVAPKIRVASSYGVAGNLTYANAQRRCASYQEMAYPAGRWRIPTKGEIEYIMKLSVDKKIPILFTNNAKYWSAEGPITATLTNGKLADPATYNNNTTAGIRCVYDQWYWEKTDYPVLNTNKTQFYGEETFKKYLFTWGDMPITQTNR